MTLYFFTRDGAVPPGDPMELPEHWNNISGLRGLPPKELAKLGWKPAVSVVPEFDDVTHT